jgi:glutathione synthase/RimK-type ligase-like ATP-grasp enzyme
LKSKCALLTINDLSNFQSYDNLIVKPLSDLSWECNFIPWDSNSINWDDFDAVIIRSTWDYQLKEKLFFKTLQSIEASSAVLYNSLETVKWNINKRYLLELERENISIIPTRLYDSFDFDVVSQLFSFFNENKLVIKPCVSANADDTFILEQSKIGNLKSALENTFFQRDFLVQPFIKNIKSEGEYSLIYFGNMLSHVLLKTPKNGDFRVQEEHGGILKEIKKPENSLIDFGNKVMSTIPYQCLYSRVDVVRGSNNYLLMEVELIEPSLYFNMDPKSPKMFAEVFNKWHG